MGVMKKLPFFLPFGGCAGRCVYCHQQAITGVSELPTPDMVALALSRENEPREVCFFGGSFCRFSFATVQAYMQAVRNFAPPKSRIRFSTYPGDLKDEKLRKLISTYNIACVELGIPSLDPAVLRGCRREADPEAIVANLTELRDESFPIGVQVMIGLPSQTIQSSISDIKKLARVKGMQDWDLRVYPTLVLEGTELHDMMKMGLYQPLSTEEAVEWGGQLLDIAETLGFRPIRVGLQESESLASQVRGGPHHPALGELISADALARKLTRANPRGPWTIPSSHTSKLTGHNSFGLKRLALYSGLSEKDTARLVFRLTDTGRGAAGR